MNPDENCMEENGGIQVNIRKRQIFRFFHKFAPLSLAALAVALIRQFF